MKNKFLGVIAIFIALLFFQCHKDLSYFGNSDPGSSSVQPDPITANVQGSILDENDQPAAGVVVTAGTSTVTTDGNGFFHISQASLDKNTTLVTAQKDGYFKAYRVFAATSGCNQVVIKLIKQNLAGTIKISGGDVSLSNGSKISLSANAVVNASSGADYSGDINVYASYINPKANDIYKTVPGSFVANDKDGKRVVLSSFGMVAVELQSSDGEKLQIKNGSVATLTIPIPPSAIAAAPSSISLWYVDDATGIWQEEGTATKDGNAYTGTVKHFSYWNCDYPYAAVDLSFTLHTPNDSPLVNAYVEVMAEDSAGGLAHGYTDSLGQVKGLVPANKNLIMKVYSLCGRVIYSQNIAAINQSTDLGTIKISDATSSLLTFTGTLLNCSGKPVTRGYAYLIFNGSARYVATNANGQFTTTFVICSGAPATATVLGVDEDNQQQGAVTTVSVTSPTTNAGNITACGTSAEQFINFSVDGTNYSITSAADDSLTATTYAIGTSSNETYISGIHGNNINNSITFTVDNASAAGTFPITRLYVQAYTSITLTQPFNVSFTNFANTAGEFYEGSFSGKFTDSLSGVHTVSSTFKVRRNY